MKYIQIDIDAKGFTLQSIDEVRAAMTHARHVARQCGISDHEMERFL